MTKWTEERLDAIRRGEPDDEWWAELQRTVAVDFDGTIHPYSKGWTGSEPDDEPPIPGAEQFIMRLLTDGYRVAIFSTRADHEDGCQGIIRWLGKHMRQVFYAMRDDGVVFVTAAKPAAVAYVDDRAVPLRAPGPDGSWADVWTRVRNDVEALANGRAHGAGYIGLGEHG